MWLIELLRLSYLDFSTNLQALCDGVNQILSFIKMVYTGHFEMMDIKGVFIDTVFVISDDWKGGVLRAMYYADPLLEIESLFRIDFSRVW